MQLKTFALASLAGSFMVAGSASAAFMGLTTELVDPVAEGWVDQGYDAGMFDTYRIYAQFDQAGIDVTAVGDPGQSMADRVFETKSLDALGDAGAGFFNSAFGSDFPPNPLFIPTAPDLQWDTFVTIGENPAQGSGGVPVTAAAPGFSDQAGGLVGDFTLDDSGWFVSAFPEFAASGDDGRVMIAQFTVNEGEHVQGLDWRVSGKEGEDENGNPILFNEFGDFNTVPAPGALALLGLAGIASRRRRR